jgi:hypothetical protein
MKGELPIIKFKANLELLENILCLRFTNVNTKDEQDVLKEYFMSDEHYDQAGGVDNLLLNGNLFEKHPVEMEWQINGKPISSDFAPTLKIEYCYFEMSEYGTMRVYLERNDPYFNGRITHTAIIPDTDENYVKYDKAHERLVGRALNFYF